MIRKLQFVAAAATACMVLAGNAWALTIDLPYSQYGHHANDEGRCAATAMINSFVFLKNTYHAYDGTNVAVGNPTDALSPIRELDDIMGGGGCGVTRQEAWEGKNEWFDTYAPGTTLIHGITDEDASAWADNANLIDETIPTAQWLLDELLKGQDVEIRLAGALHWVTLTGITTGADGKGLSIRYIDPNCPTGTQNVAVTYDLDGYIHFGWRNGDGTNCTEAAIDAKITTAFAESPLVPEPAMLAIFGTSLIALVIVRRRNRA
jgi:hypothetical protein